ncbi:MAG TPA: hypothetical protein VGQ83_25840 [Polyangia bacterium]|jgi:hypothetical protein
MKISSRTIQRQAAALLLCAGLVGCGPIIERAPFRARPDSTAPADLLGPYDGRVLDADTDKPVAGAVVYASWAFERGLGFVAPQASAEITIETDLRGAYRIPRLDSLPGGLSTRLMRFTLIVYRRGYAAYRSDRIFGDLAARHDFVQRGNLVRLAPWTPEMSHARHVVFLGGGTTVRRASSWEWPLAAVELEQTLAPPRPASRPAQVALLDAAPLLTADEIRAVTGYKGLLDEKRLQDLERTAFYDSRHFQAISQPQAFDVALRVWRLGPAAVEHYERLRKELPGAREENDVGDRAFRAQEGEIRALVFVAADAGVVIEITCGTSQCKTPEQLTALGRRVLTKLKLLSLTPTSQPAPAEPPATPEPARPPEPSPERPGEGGFQLKPPGVLKP